jgi:hypothetical protein
MAFEVAGKSGLINSVILAAMVGPFTATCDRLLNNWGELMEENV